MDTAAAMAQIQAVMSAPTDPVSCVVLRVDGSCEEVVIDQRKLSELLGGVPTVVGAIASLDVQAVAKQGAKRKSKHTFPTDMFDEAIKGDVVLFRTGDNAEPVPFTSAEYAAWVDAGRPNDVQESDEDDDAAEGEEEEGEEGEEMEGEESEESDEDESESFEDFCMRMGELPLAELRKACKLCELSDKGSKADLLARMYEHAQANASEEDSDDEDSGEEGSDEDECDDPIAATREYLSQLDEAKLKDACSKLGLSKSGGKQAIIDRMCEALTAGGGVDDEEEESDEEDDEDEDNHDGQEAAVEPKQPTRAGAKSSKAKSPPVPGKATGASPGPVKTIAKGKKMRSK